MLQTIGERCAGGGKGGNRVRLGLWVSSQGRGGQVQQRNTTWFFECEVAIWLWLRPSIGLPFWLMSPLRALGAARSSRSSMGWAAAFILSCFHPSFLSFA